METIEEIVREMRTLGRLDEKSTDYIPRSLQALGLRTYANRIEAAMKARLISEDKMYRNKFDEAIRALYWILSHSNYPDSHIPLPSVSPDALKDWRCRSPIEVLSDIYIFSKSVLDHFSKDWKGENK